MSVRDPWSGTYTVSGRPSMYRYRCHKHGNLRATTKKAAVRRGAFVAYLRLSHAARKLRRGTLTASYVGDATHGPAKVNQRVKLTLG